jgi:hypothetical protein
MCIIIIFKTVYILFKIKNRRLTIVYNFRSVLYSASTITIQTVLVDTL